MIRAASVEANIDLRPFLRLMREYGLRFQVSEESGRQVVWTATEVEAARIANLMEAWRSGQISPAVSPPPPAGRGALVNGMGRQVLDTGIRVTWMAPITISLIAACLVVALITQMGTRLDAVGGLFFPRFNISDSSQVLALLGQINDPIVALRTLTPIFLHFGALHLVFNMLWMWVLGRAIELVLRPGFYLALIVVTAFCGNAAQYLWSLQVNFGGMSGVLYGLIGFIWVWQTLRPASRLQLPPAMIAVFLGALVLMEVLASGFIATAAHVGGLVSGMAAGGLFAVYNGAERRKTRRW